jgi:porin
LQLDYTTESTAVLSGGKSKGGDYVDQIGFESNVDWDKLADLSGFSTHTAIVHRDGRNTSTIHLGDQLLQSQELYGGGGDVAAHLVLFYGEQKLLDDSLDIAAGRLPIGNDFAASTLYCNYMQVAICGNPHSISATPGVTVWPVSTWGGRARYTIADPVYVQTGVFEANPQNGGRSGFDWSLDDATGETLPVEIGYTPTLGTERLPGHYKIGFLYNTSGYPAFSDAYVFQGGSDQNTSFNPSSTPELAATGLGGPHHAFNGWLLADQMLWRNGPGDSDGLTALAGYTQGDGKVDVFHNYVFAGLLDSAFWTARPEDTAGLFFTYAKISRNLRAEQMLETQWDLPLSDVANGIQKRELVMEANYDVHVSTGINLTPDVQYVVRPGGISRYPNAVLVGLKTHMQF